MPNHPEPWNNRNCLLKRAITRTTPRNWTKYGNRNKKYS
jgi:hypothetical protein